PAARLPSFVTSVVAAESRMRPPSWFGRWEMVLSLLPIHWHSLVRIRDLATHTGAPTTWPKAISSALCLVSRGMLLQYRISLCWEQQRGRDMELMVDRATLLHIGFSTPSEEGGYIQ